MCAVSPRWGAVDDARRLTAQTPSRNNSCREQPLRPTTGFVLVNAAHVSWSILQSNLTGCRRLGLWLGRRSESGVPSNRSCPVSQRLPISVLRSEYGPLGKSAAHRWSTRLAAQSLSRLEDIDGHLLVHDRNRGSAYLIATCTGLAVWPSAV